MVTYKSEDTVEASSTPSDQHPVSDFIQERKGWLSKLWPHKMKLPRVTLVYKVIPAWVSLVYIVISFPQY